MRRERSPSRDSERRSRPNWDDARIRSPLAQAVSVQTPVGNYGSGVAGEVSSCYQLVFSCCDFIFTGWIRKKWVLLFPL